MYPVVLIMVPVLVFHIRLIKTKLTMGLNTGFNFSKNPIYINNVINKTKTNSYNFGTRLDLTPSDIFTLLYQCLLEYRQYKLFHQFQSEPKST